MGILYDEMLRYAIIRWNYRVSFVPRSCAQVASSRNNRHKLIALDYFPGNGTI